MEDKVLMTKEGFAALHEELTKLITVDRREIVAAIEEAREKGDLSENAEYHAAKERQAFTEGKIAELEDVTARAQVIDPAEIKSDKILFGATVTLVDEETEKEITYKIVGRHEADIKKGLISIESPIAKAMIGKKVDDEVEVNAPSGIKNYAVISIEYK